MAPVPEERTLLTEIAELKRRLRELEGRTLQNVTVSRGGLVVKDGGELTVRHPSSDWLLHVGKGAQDKYFLTIRRDNGSVAFEISTFVTGQQVWTMWDQNQKVLVSEDSNGGLGRPWLSVPTVNILSSTIPMAANATYIATQGTGWFLKQQPKVELQALLRSTAGGVGSARFTVNGAQVGDVMPIDSGDFGWAPLQTVTLPGDVDTFVRVELEVVLTNATGQVGGVFTCSQRQS